MSAWPGPQEPVAEELPQGQPGQGPFPPSSALPGREPVVAAAVVEAVVEAVVDAVVVDPVPVPVPVRAHRRPAQEARGTPPDAVPPSRSPASARPASTPLPRLAPAQGGPARGDRLPVTPEVVVTIGRIEVVPPPPEPPPPAPRPQPHPRASGAPALADYLRERSRR